jgi:predicted O-methyltransferase YrrM
MSDQTISDSPAVLPQLQQESRSLGFRLASEPLTGSLLRTLAASKPGGALLELGTGTGVGTAWLLAGMDPSARLTTIDNDPKVMAVARRHLSGDRRVTFHLLDAAGWLPAQPGASYDLIFADAWAGKYSHLDEALRLLRPGGLYVVDDMLPQENWPADHAPKVERLVAELEGRRGLALTKLSWSTGIIIATARR